jgi:hypothetical protein
VESTDPAERDPYWKLRPPPATPEDEICKCADRPPIVLQTHLTSNPIVCLRCNLEVPPERLGFSADLADNIAYWRNLYEAYFALWLDASDYESCARAYLEDPDGRLNVCGREIVRELNGVRRSYYWWFQDATEDAFVPLSQCPRCSANLVERYGRLVCEACSIVVPNG